MLYQFYAAWRDQFRASVGRFLPESALADRIAAAFKAAAADTEQLRPLVPVALAGEYLHR